MRQFGKTRTERPSQTTTESGPYFASQSVQKPKLICLLIERHTNPFFSRQRLAGYWQSIGAGQYLPLETAPLRGG